MASELTDTELMKLRQRLMTYPGATEESVEELILAYETRAQLKQTLIEERGMSNALAETFLDTQGYPRPPGWHSVFFYPGGGRPRNKYLFLALVIIGLAFFLAS